MNPKLLIAMERICRKLYRLSESNTTMTTCNVKKNFVEAEFHSDIADLKVKVPRGIVEDFANNQEDIVDYIEDNYDISMSEEDETGEPVEHEVVDEEVLEEEVSDGNEEANKKDNKKESKKPPRRRS